MSFDYDLLVIGNSLAGILTALRATSFKARVALVKTESSSSSSSSIALWSAILSRGLYYWLNHAMTDFPVQPTESKFSVSSYASEVLNSLNEEYSSAVLNSKGIDVLEGNGEFCRRPQPAFIVNKTHLRSRSYLLALEASPFVPNILGLEETGYLTLLDFQNKKIFQRLDGNLTIIALHPIALELAQTLAKLGKSITLIIEDDCFVKKVDFQAFKLILAMLKGSGVNLILEDCVTQVRQIEDKKWLQVGHKAIETDEIIVIHYFKPNFNGLNLEAMGINPHQIQLNSQVQTVHPSIYSFSYDEFLNPNYEEIELIIKNTLFFPIFKLTGAVYNEIIYTQPTFAQIGYTEMEAKKHFKKPILVGKKDFKYNLKSQIFEQNSGFIKLIASNDSRLIGATIVGDGAEEIASFLSLAIREKISLSRLLKISFPLLSYSQIISQAALDALEKAERKRLNKWLVSWFIWRKL